jgi:hypothetical protein
VSNEQTPDEATLVRYLTGSMSDDEVERLDELSIADEQFALRLRAVEHDLVDAYVSGELTGDTLDGFTSQYLSSPAGLAKVQIAQALRGYFTRAAEPVRRTSTARTTLASMSRWGLAAAALLLLAVAGYLFAENARLRREVLVRQEALQQRERQLQQELQDQRSATAAAAQELDLVRRQLAEIRQPQLTEKTSVLAFLLLPATRGAGEIATVTIPRGTSALTLRLQLEDSEFAQYRAELKEAGTSRAVWQSSVIHPSSTGGRRFVRINVPASIFRSQPYVVELRGLAPGREAELASTYPFRAVVQ